MGDVSCPYCGTPQEINHDDGYGYAEDKVYEQRCDTCDKNFSFATSILYYYEASKVVCLHRWKSTFTFPVSHTKMECCNCGDRRSPTGYEMVLITKDRS